MKKQIMVPVAALALIAIMLATAVTTNAHFQAGPQHDAIVQRLSQRLGVEESQVAAVFEEMRAEHEQEQWQEMTSEERRAEREADQAELEAWAQSQGIGLEYFFGPKGGHMGRAGTMHKGWDR